MREELEALAESQHQRLVEFMGRVRLTPELIEKHGKYLARHYAIQSGDIADPDGALAREAREHVAKLYEATSPWPPATVGMLTMNYMRLQIARREADLVAFVRALIGASFGLGFSTAEMDLCLPRNLSIARGIVEALEGEEKREKLVRSGSEGGATKNAPYRKLKEWALGEATQMRGSSKQIARQLTLRLPAELQGISVDPERVIYQELLGSKKKAARLL